MQRLFAALLFMVFNTIGHAQTTVPFTFSAGSPARASEVNANFQALASAINTLNATVNSIGGGALSAANVAGNYAFISLEVETGGGLSQVVHHGSENGTVTLNSDMTFTLSASINSAFLNLAVSPSLAFNTTTAASPLTDSGTWNLAGNVVTLNLNGAGISVPFISAGGRNLFLNAIHTDDRRDNSLVFLIRTN